MAYSLRNWRTLAALLFAVVVVCGAYVAARTGGRPRVAEASTETALLEQIASKDSDGDGLPDWEEALYGTDPHKIDTRGLGMTDGEAVAKGLIVPQATADIPQATSSPSGSAASDYGLTAPAEGSLTDTFAKNFFTLYLNAKQANNGAALTEQQTSDLANQAMAELTASVAPAPDFKSMHDLTVSGSGPDALRAFAASAENVLAAQQNHESKSELLYLQDALNGDASALTHIKIIANSYTGAARGISVLPVPTELASADLALINAMERVGEISGNFLSAETDPITTMLALEQYPQAVLDMANAFISINEIYLSANVVLAPGTPGAAFVNVIPNTAARQQSSP